MRTFKQPADLLRTKALFMRSNSLYCAPVDLKHGRPTGAHP